MTIKQPSGLTVHMCWQ